jgi:hypothetical protein
MNKHQPIAVKKQATQTTLQANRASNGHGV